MKRGSKVLNNRVPFPLDSLLILQKIKKFLLVYTFKKS